MLRLPFARRYMQIVENHGDIGSGGCFQYISACFVDSLQNKLFVKSINQIGTKNARIFSKCILKFFDV